MYQLIDIIKHGQSLSSCMQRGWQRVLCGCFGLLFIALSVKGEERGALILRSPQDYQVYAISPNGEWACGLYVNMNNMSYGFRWNLLSGETELLSGDLCLSGATAISNDGVVTGMFDNTEATDNGAPAYTAGWWKDGRWHHLPNINNAPVLNRHQVGYAYAITPDGTYVGGAYNDKNGGLIPIIWKDGKIEHMFEPTDNTKGMIYTLSADGKRAAGWSITPNSEQARVATIWEVGKGATLIMDERLSNAWCSARKFSPNGKYLLYWEGFYDTPADQITNPAASNMALRALYNVETGEKTDMPTITRHPFNFDVFDVTDSGTIVGYESPEATMLDQAVIFKNDSTYWLYDYLQAQGVDLDADKSILRENGSTYFIRGIGISNDEKTYAVLYYDTEGALRSMVIKLDEDLATREPVQLEATPLAGTKAARLMWQAPLAGAEGVTGYNLYRDGVKVNAQPITATSYIDNVAADGSVAYHVTALYADVESKASQTVTMQVDKALVQAPRNLFARQVGYCGGLLQWDAPRSNLTVKSYYPEGGKVTGFGGGNNSFEAAICIPAAETALYEGSLLQSVSFYPMTAQTAWKVNIYKAETDEQQGDSAQAPRLSLIYSQPISQPLIYSKENVVTLTTPVEVPAGTDLYVAIEVTVPITHIGYNVLGEVNGDPIPGLTDLIRMTSEPDFYSLYEEGLKFGATQLTTWAIGANLSAKADKAESIDLVDHYVVFDAMEELGTTTDRTFSLDSLPAGDHTLGVRAVYADGRTSEIVPCPLAIVPNEQVFKPVESVDIARPTDHSVVFSWQAPVDNDETFLTHSTDVLQGGVLGPVANNYNYIAATIYSPAMTQGYEGYRVEAFKFYPLTTAEFTFFLEEDGKVIAEAWPEVYTPGLWCTVKLSETVTIKAGSTYRLLLDCYDVTPGEAPLGLDARMPYVNEGDLYSINEGSTYTSITQTSAFGNWMMGLVLVSPHSKPLSVEGYHVRIDNKQANEALLAEPTFAYEFPQGDATHRLNVDVCYPAERTVKGRAIFFQVGPSGLGHNSMAVLRVQHDECFIRVTGAEVKEVTLFNNSGQMVAQAQGSELDITGLSAGTYVLRTTTAEGVFTRKLSLIK